MIANFMSFHVMFFFLRNNCVLFSQTSDAKRRSSSVSRTLHHLGVTPFEDTASPGAGNNPQGPEAPRWKNSGLHIVGLPMWVYPHVETGWSSATFDWELPNIIQKQQPRLYVLGNGRQINHTKHHVRIFSPQTTSPTMENRTFHGTLVPRPPVIFGPPILGGVSTIAMGDSQLLGAHA